MGHMEFSIFSETAAKLEETSSRLEMISILAKLFEKAHAGNVDKIIYLLQGQIAPPFVSLDVGIGEKFVERAIAISSGYTQGQVHAAYRKTGDLGKAAEQLMEKKKQTSLVSKELTVEDVHEVFVKISKTMGKGSQDTKIKLLAELLSHAAPLDARYIVRIPVGKLQLGVGDPTILDALSKAKEGDKSMREELERAYNLSSDLGDVANRYYEGKLKGKESIIKLFNPIRPALAERVNEPEEVIERHKTTAAEVKLDGFRTQIHKKGNEIRIFSRRLENTTNAFPEIVRAVRENVHAKEAIIDGEALAYNETTGELYPFQMTIQRKRKHGIAEKAEELPLHVFAFDLIYLNGEDYTQKPYIERRKALERIIKPDGISLTESITTEDPKVLRTYFKKAIERGTEGLVCKDLNAPYKAGARGFNWIKLKRSYRGELADTIDIVIVGYYLGKGTRAQFKFGGFLGAVYDEKEDMFKTVTRVGSGFTEEMMKKLEHLLSDTTVEKKPARVDSLVEPDFWVRPKYVITVKADEITESPMHTAGRKEDTGYALRFPRMIGDVRADKNPEDATTVKEIIEMFKLQRRTQLQQ
jgi:DNA ligase-1